MRHRRQNRALAICVDWICIFFHVTNTNTNNSTHSSDNGANLFTNTHTHTHTQRDSHACCVGVPHTRCTHTHTPRETNTDTHTNANYVTCKLNFLFHFRYMRKLSHTLPPPLCHPWKTYEKQQTTEKIFDFQLTLLLFSKNNNNNILCKLKTVEKKTYLLFLHTLNRRQRNVNKLRFRFYMART